MPYNCNAPCMSSHSITKGWQYKLLCFVCVLFTKIFQSMKSYYRVVVTHNWTLKTFKSSIENFHMHKSNNSIGRFFIVISIRVSLFIILCALFRLNEQSNKYIERNNAYLFNGKGFNPRNTRESIRKTKNFFWLTKCSKVRE